VRIRAPGALPLNAVFDRQNLPTETRLAWGRARGQAAQHESRGRATDCRLRRRTNTPQTTAPSTRYGPRRYRISAVTSNRPSRAKGKAIDRLASTATGAVEQGVEADKAPSRRHNGESGGAACAFAHRALCSLTPVFGGRG
jgi:hypothetical protein